MDSVISIPAPLSRRADDLAQRLHKTLSEIVTEALNEYIAHHDPSTVTERLNAVYDALPEAEDRFATEKTRSILQPSEW